jgi:hypothetical protein
MRTLYSLSALVGLGVAAAALAPSAHAADWSIGIGLGVPGVVVVSPPPAYVVAPPPRYYVPPSYVPGYYPPPPGYYQPPTAIGYWDRDGDYWRHREWRHHHHHHDDDDED